MPTPDTQSGRARPMKAAQMPQAGAPTQPAANEAQGISPARPVKRAMFMMLLCAALWSMAGLFIKSIPWHPLAIASGRSLIAALVVGAYMVLTRTRFVLCKKSIFGGLALALTSLCFVSANKLTTAANAIVLQFTAPLFMLLFDTLVRKRPCSRLDAAAVVLTTAGIAFSFMGQFDATGMLGNGLAVLAGMCYAGMYLITGDATVEERMSGILVGQLITMGVGLPMLIAGRAAITPSAVGYVVLLGVLQLGVPYLLYGMAARDISPLACCLLSALEPLLNPVWVFLVHGEAPGAWPLVGGVLVIATITAWSVLKGRQGRTA